MYLIFSGSDFYPAGGSNDLVGHSESEDEAKLRLAEIMLQNGEDWGHVFNLETMKVVFCLPLVRQSYPCSGEVPSGIQDHAKYVTEAIRSIPDETIDSDALKRKITLLRDLAAFKTSQKHFCEASDLIKASDKLVDRQLVAYIKENKMGIVKNLERIFPDEPLPRWGIEGDRLVCRNRYGKKLDDREWPCLPDGSKMPFFTEFSAVTLKRFRDDDGWIEKGTEVKVSMMPSGDIYLKHYGATFCTEAVLGTHFKFS